MKATSCMRRSEQERIKSARNQKPSF